MWRIGKVVLGIILASVSISSVIETLKTVDLISVVAASLWCESQCGSTYGISSACLVCNLPCQLSNLSLPVDGHILRFFNGLLPSAIGGDAYRALHMSKYKSDAGIHEALSIVFVDRVLGLLGMMLIGLAALAIGSTPLPARLNLWIGRLFALLILLFIFSTSTQFHGVTLKLVAIRRIKDHLVSFFNQLNIFSERRALPADGLIVSVVLALHLHLTIYVYLITIPIIELIRTIPITVQV